MRRLKTLVSVGMMISSIIFLTGCFGGKTPPKQNDETGIVSVSFIGTTEPELQPKLFLHSLTPTDVSTRFDRSLYLPPFNDENLEPLDSFTPEKFIIGLYDIEMSQPGKVIPLSLTKRIQSGERSTFGIPTHFDIVNSRDILQGKYITKYGEHKFDQILISFSGVNREAYPYNDFVRYSQIYVDMGPRYAGITFKNQSARDGDYHVFEFMDLIPFLAKEDYMQGAAVAFSDNVPPGEEYIVNPSGKVVSNFNPYYWDSPRRWSFNGYIIYRSGLPFDLSGGKKSLVFKWDLFKAIEVYEIDGEYIATLRLDNPFPISFELYDAPSENLPPTTGELTDVTMADVRYYDIVNREIVVTWLNPVDNVWQNVLVFRKVNSPFDGSNPEKSAELVYSGRFPMYVDTDIQQNNDYYYMIMTEDYEGNRSNGVVVSIRTEPLDVQTIFIEPSQGVIVPVNGTLDLRAAGRNSAGDRIHINPTWSLVGEIGNLGLTFGDRNTFTATEPGNGLIKIELERYDSTVLEDTIEITVVSD